MIENHQTHLDLDLTLHMKVKNLINLQGLSMSLQRHLYIRWEIKYSNNITAKSDVTLL